ncbi:MAG: WXG100 family type VII secretion target [Angustibacter sp.]
MDDEELLFSTLHADGGPSAIMKKPYTPENPQDSLSATTNSPSGRASLQSMDYDEAERAVRSIAQSSAAIELIGDRINEKVTVLIDNDFKGDAANSYQVAFNRWHKGCAQIKQNLLWLGEQMAEATDGVQYEEANLAAANAAYEAPNQQVY